MRSGLAAPVRSGKCAFIFVFGNLVLDLHKTEIKCTCTKDKRQPLAHARDAHAHTSCCPGPERAPNTAFEIVPVNEADAEDKSFLEKDTHWSTTTCAHAQSQCFRTTALGGTCSSNSAARVTAASKSCTFVGCAATHPAVKFLPSV